MESMLTRTIYVAASPPLRVDFIHSKVQIVAPLLLPSHGFAHKLLLQKFLAGLGSVIVLRPNLQISRAFAPSSNLGQAQASLQTLLARPSSQQVQSSCQDCKLNMKTAHSKSKKSSMPFKKLRTRLLENLVLKLMIPLSANHGHSFASAISLRQ